MLARFRRWTPPVSIAVFAAFVSALIRPTNARATEDAPPIAESAAEAIADAAAAKEIEGAPAEKPNAAAGKSAAAKLPTQAPKAMSPDAAAKIAGSLPKQPAPLDPVTGAPAVGVTTQSISVPQGAGKIQGMGESFSAQLSTGIGTFSVPFALSPARGAASPSLTLSYSSSGGHGIAGVGWDVGVPFIARQTDRRVPTYNDPPQGGPWHPEQDRFVYNGGQELVPICLVKAGVCDGAIGGALNPIASVPKEVMPSWAEGWQYFRPRVEGAFLRFFWSPDHRTWRVQDKSGVLMELGVPMDGTNRVDALETHPTAASKIFRWNLARQLDTYNDEAFPTDVIHAHNPVLYFYAPDGALAYLTDIYDTPPAATPTTASTSTFAHHTRLRYEVRPDATISYRRGWLTTQAKRLVGVDVTSKPFQGDASSPRKVVRRYHLAYDANYHVSLLNTVTLEGRCTVPVTDTPPADPEADVTIAEDGSGHLPDDTACPTLPPMTLGYHHVTPYTIDGSPGAVDLTGYEGIDERLHTLDNSPPYSLDDGKTGLFDVNADALPDVVTTSAGDFGGCHGLFFNGNGGKADVFNASTIAVFGVNGDDETVIAFANPNVNPLDVDGDGIVDLLHMPQVKTYAVYTPQTTTTNGCPSPSPWIWKGRAITTAAALSPKIDFSTDATNIREMDVNGDGLVDVVRSTGTEYQTYFALGRYPGGDGQFGAAKWTGAATANLSNDPVSMCVPWAGSPVQLGDPDVRIADMNGDGLPDIVRVRLGDVQYWPGRGNGLFGTGELDDCAAGTFGENRSIAMAQSPFYTDVDGDSLRLDDVNGDGLDDLVQIRFDAVDVWLNVDGTGWTPNRHTISGTPASPGYANRVRLTDINGSGTRDILWGDGLTYQYIDVAGGERPWVLTHVENGLGKTTDITYASSPSLMIAAAAAGSPWSSSAPMPLHVVTSVTESDNLLVGGNAAGTYVTTYTYRDPVYDGRQREFRGFRDVSVKRVGDKNSPSATTHSTFLLGECAQDEPGDDPCTHANTWMDNPREALKGLPVVSDTFDDNGVYQSTEHKTYTLRKLYKGLDHREVRHAFETTTDRFVYDTGAFKPAAETIKLAEVIPELSKKFAGVSSMVPPPPDPSAPNAYRSVQLASKAGRAHVQTGGGVPSIPVGKVVDPFGNQVSASENGCVDGCASVDETIVTRTLPLTVPSDATGWMFRTAEAYVFGTLHPGLRKHTRTSYDLHGQPVKVEAFLDGLLSKPIWRFHEDPNASTAPLPNDVITQTNHWHVTALTEYDGGASLFGNVTAQAGANGRCRETGYDPVYQDLATTETVYVGSVDNGIGAKCGKSLGVPRGSVDLTATADYDRGLGVTTAAHDLHDELTIAAMDGLGRPVALWKPDPKAAGAVSSLRSVKIDYFLPQGSAGPAYSKIHTATQDGADPDTNSYVNAWAYVDGLGRTVLTLQEADPSAGDQGDWVASGLTEYDAKGAPRRAYRSWFYDGAPDAFDLTKPPPASYGTQRYDAFGRSIETHNLDGSISLKTVHHALSRDLHDAADLEPGPHQGTYASERVDGHGRTVATTERAHVAGSIEAREVRTSYLVTGVPESITRVRLGANGKVVDQVMRWMRYDSLDRLVLNVEPSTTPDFTNDTAMPDGKLRAWRYAYDLAGDLLATSDARGCGVNYAYDLGGRLLYEDYSPCTKQHAPYSAPDVAAESGIEVLYRYDTKDPASDESGCVVDESLLKGRLTSISDRAAHTLTSYDGRGRGTCVARQIAKPGPAEDLLAVRYAPRWYHQGTSYDAADRVVDDDTGANAQQLQANGKSAVHIDYAKSGAVKTVGGTYGTLVSSIVRDADRLVQHIEYGDLAKTSTDYLYDNRKRVHSVQTYRGPPGPWTTLPSDYQPAPTYGQGATNFQLLLEDLDYEYDAVDNPTAITDHRIPDEWPTGAKPSSRAIQYDDLYRVSRIDYQYKDGTDAWTSPFAAEDVATSAGAPSPTDIDPAPHTAFANRALYQTFAYDWLGNTTATDDDAHGFYDRSLGAITNGPTTTQPKAGPYQLTSAAGGGGQLGTQYDPAGNLIQLDVQRTGTCLPVGAHCTNRYSYAWDEVGRLVSATRADAYGAEVVPRIELDYAYDAHDERVVKTVAPVGFVSAARGSTLYVFDSLELRGTQYAANAQGVEDYQDDETTEAVYLFAKGVRLAHVEYRASGMPAYPGAPAPVLAGGSTHVLLELQDHLGSTSIVLDKATGELVEAGTYLGFGQAESDYRSGRWGDSREAYRFTGKEEDVEVGLTYFGKRLLSSYLGRWVSPDPLAIHAGGGDPNPYAYVRHQLLKAIDPVGLDEACKCSQSWEALPGADSGRSTDQKVNAALARVLTQTAPLESPNTSLLAQSASPESESQQQAVVDRALNDAYERRPALERAIAAAKHTYTAAAQNLAADIFDPTQQAKNGLAGIVPHYAIYRFATEVVLPAAQGVRQGRAPEVAGSALGAVGFTITINLLNEGAARGSGAGLPAVKVGDIVPYRPASRGLENHHGVLDVWATANIEGYVSRAAESPTIALTPEQHGATKGVYRSWLEERTGKPVGGKVDWTAVGPREVFELSERMFDAAGVTKDARGAYYREFNNYIYRQ